MQCNQRKNVFYLLLTVKENLEWIVHYSCILPRSLATLNVVCVWRYRNAVYSLKENCSDAERTEAEGCLRQPNILLPCLSTVCCDHCVWKSTGNALENPHWRDEKECWLPELEILWRIQACKWENPSTVTLLCSVLNHKARLLFYLKIYFL